MIGLCDIFLVSRLLTACADPSPVISGYAEGEYVLVAPVATARVVSLEVRRGDRLAAGQAIASLDDQDTALAVKQAESVLAQVQARLADLHKGRRPTEMRAASASLAAAEAELREAELALNRTRDLTSRGVLSEANLDRARASHATARAKVDEMKANLETAGSGARTDEIAAQAERVDEARAALEMAKWHHRQRRLTAPAAGEVSDILRRPGEIAGPSAPVVSFLPDGAVKLRLFVPQAARAAFPPGARLSVACDGCPSDLAAVVTYLSEEPEFTPPVIYSVDRRQKLVYLVEARPLQASSVLQPGLIVDARPQG